MEQNSKRGNIDRFNFQGRDLAIEEEETNNL